ncbi:hypothetical protein BD626DRAFT_495206 [Schizophyllum amplum]|uniref:Secreted protein n=1 Tax=Schizophyllum amplum TaxID=97359 RepID=A0A550CG00_9AGAR|nr:hypothetical protein BD626DRAFT_495206 [Auriculariopsis ampla]
MLGIAEAFWRALAGLTSSCSLFSAESPTSDPPSRPPSFPKIHAVSMPPLNFCSTGLGTSPLQALEMPQQPPFHGAIVRAPNSITFIYAETPHTPPALPL